MKLSRNAAAWELVCQRWQIGHHWFDDVIAPAQRSAHEHLVELKAVKPLAVNQQFALCGHCGLHTAQVYREGRGLGLRCPECGPVPAASSGSEKPGIRSCRTAMNSPCLSSKCRYSSASEQPAARAISLVVACETPC